MRRGTTVTAQQFRVGIGREVVEAYPVQAQFLLNHVSGVPDRTINLRFSAARTGRPNRKTDARKGGFRLAGSITVEATPDGGFPILLGSRFPWQTTTGANPFTHNYANLFGTTANPFSSDTFTLIVEDPKWLTIYSGCCVGNFSLAVGDGADGDVVQATAEVYALNTFFVPNTGPNRTVWGMDTAGFGALPAFVPEDALVSYNGRQVCVKDFSLTCNRNMEGKLCRNGKNGVEAYIEGDSETSFTATGYYLMTEPFFRSAGYTAEPPGVWGDTAVLVTDVVTIDFAGMPVGALTPRMTFTIPKASTTTMRPVERDGVVMQNLESTPLDAAAGDVQVTIVNAVSQAVTRQFQPTPPFANIPPTQWVWLWGGDFRNTYVANVAVPVTAPSYHIEGVEAVATPGIRQAAVTDNFFVGKNMVMLSGAAIGAVRAVVGNVASTDVITLASIMTSASAGDRFALVDP
jgi:hypothetical protein